jgi:GT2 family glycosyltransferase
VEAPDVTVSVVSHAKRDLVLRCVAALEADAPGRYRREIVVLDNASDDGTVEALREGHPAVRVIPRRYRAGFGANHNAVIRETSGRYVFVLNDDALVRPGCTETLVRHLDRHVSAGAAAPRIEGPDGICQQTAWRRPSPLAGAGDTPHRVGWLSACALMLRRAALEDVGLFDEAFFMYSEDADLGQRLAQRGWESHYVPTATVVHLSRQSSTGLPERQLVEQWRGAWRYWRKHHSAAGARLASAAFALGFALRAIAVGVLKRLPLRVQVTRAAPGEFLAAARYALREPRGPGLKELADDWNSRGKTVE